MSVFQKTWFPKFIFLSAFLFTGCFNRSIPLGMGDLDWGVEITWHGQSCFSVRDSLGRLVVIDPFDSTVGYGRLYLKADALLVTHNHFDHNATLRVKAKGPNIDLMNSSGTVAVAGDMQVKGIESYHDAAQGNHHGDNLIFVFKMAGLKIAHFGDFGQDKLTPYQRSELGPIDVLMIPVGGFTTIGPKRAKQLVEQLKPKFVFPMHYGKIRFYHLAEVNKFTQMFNKDQILASEENQIRIRMAELPKKPQIVTLKPIDRNY